MTRARRITAMALFVAAASAHGADYFVRVTGSNANNGTSPEAAWASVSHAVQRVGAGDTVYIGAGVYTGQLYMSNRGGTQNNPVRFVADTDGARTGDAGEVTLTNAGLAHVQRSSHTHFVGLNLVSTGQTLIYNDNSQGLLLEDCTLTGSGGALSGHNGGSFIVRNCTITANGNHAVYLAGGSLEMSDTTVLKTGTQHSSVHAANNATVTIERSSLLDGNHIIYSSGSTITLINTVLANARASGLHVANQTRLTMVHCTINNITHDAIYADGGNHFIRNTIFSNAGRYMYFRANNANINESHCLYSGWGSQLAYNFTPSNPVLAAPEFTDASADDYTLTAGSAAIDAGTDASDHTANDRLARARPQADGWDIGAFEGVGGTNEEGADDAGGGGTGRGRVVRWLEIAPLESE